MLQRNAAAAYFRLRLVPARDRRILLALDDELDAALARARAALGSHKPDATVVRELLLAGVEVVASKHEDSVIAQLVREFGAAPARMTSQEMLRRRGPLPPVDRRNLHGGSRALDELRDDRV
jgi:plasmid stability protein